MVAAAAGIIATSYFLYEPNVFPLSMLNAQLGQLAVYGGLAAAVTAFTWFWPGAGGIIAIVAGLFYLLQLPQTPSPLNYIFYGLFFSAGAFSFFAGLIQKKAPYTPTPSVIMLRQWARNIAFGIIIVFVIAYIFIYTPLIFFTVPAIVIVAIAWLWPAPGGILMLVISVPGYYPLVNVGWQISWKWPIYILLAIFIASAIMHLIAAWKIRKLRLAFTG
jgi:hypothetical protein